MKARLAPKKKGRGSLMSRMGKTGKVEITGREPGRGGRGKLVKSAGK